MKKRVPDEKATTVWETERVKVEEKVKEVARVKVEVRVAAERLVTANESL